MKPKEILILAGGRGTRIEEALPGIPKLLAPIGNKRFLDYLISYYSNLGLEKFIFSLGYLSELVIEYLEINYRNLGVEVVVEPEPLGTGGAIKNALSHCNTNTVLTVNGDTYFRIELDKVAVFHHMCGAECTLFLKKLANSGRYGTVSINPDYSVKNFSEKTEAGEALINGGVYLINKRLFLENDLPEKFSFEKDYLETRAGSRRIFAAKQDGYFIDIGLPADLEKAREELKNYD